jgi:hypothetical protein
MSRAEIHTDEQLLAMDIPAAIARGALSGDVTVAAAIRADRVHAQPRSLTFLAEIIRRGGLAAAARLSEPLATTEQSALVREWLVAAAEEEEFARWLDAVALVLTARLATRLSGS